MRVALHHHAQQIEYAEGVAWQEHYFLAMVAEKMSSADRLTAQDRILTCRHPPVFTLGKSGKADNLLVSKEVLQAEGIGYYPTSRGGDITYHGPGQIIVYPILDLERYFTDIHRYLRTLEEAVIRTLAHFGIAAGRIDGLTGVWVGDNKICAMGVKASRWIVMHGLALNVDPNLAYFRYIVPCNISDKGVTSMARELNTIPNEAVVQTRLLAELSAVFGFELVEANDDMLSA